LSLCIDNERRGEEATRNAADEGSPIHHRISSSTNEMPIGYRGIAL
jgi:hypothetical protein